MLAAAASAATSRRLHGGASSRRPSRAILRSSCICCCPMVTLEPTPPPRRRAGPDTRASGLRRAQGRRRVGGPPPRRPAAPGARALPGSITFRPVRAAWSGPGCRPRTSARPAWRSTWTTSCAGRSSAPAVSPAGEPARSRAGPAERCGADEPAGPRADPARAGLPAGALAAARAALPVLPVLLVVRRPGDHDRHGAIKGQLAGRTPAAALPSVEPWRRRPRSAEADCFGCPRRAPAPRPPSGRDRHTCRTSRVSSARSSTRWRSSSPTSWWPSTPC